MDKSTNVTFPRKSRHPPQSYDALRSVEQDTEAEASGEEWLQDLTTALTICKASAASHPV